VSPKSPVFYLEVEHVYLIICGYDDVLFDVLYHFRLIKIDIVKTRNIQQRLKTTINTELRILPRPLNCTNHWRALSVTLAWLRKHTFYATVSIY